MVPVFESVGRYLRFTRDVTACYSQLMAQAVAASGLSKPEGDVLLFLANSPQLDTARDACEYRGFSKAYVSKAVESLCIRGYLRPTSDEADRRVQHLTVLPTARDAVERLQQAQQQFFETLTAGMTQEDTQQLVQIMERMHENVQCAEA